MTTLADQVEQLLGLAQDAAASSLDPWRRQAILNAVAGVWAAWDAGSLGLPCTDAHSRMGSGEVWGYVDWRLSCVDWSYTLRQRLDALADAVAPVDAGVAEAAGAMSDQVRGATEEANSVTTPRARDSAGGLLLLGLALWLLGGRRAR